MIVFCVTQDGFYQQEHTGCLQLELGWYEIIYSCRIMLLNI